MKENALTIRKASAKDTALLYQLIKGLASYERRPDDVTCSEETLKHCLFERKIATAIIAEYNGEPIGYAIYYQAFASFAAKMDVHLEDIFIKEEYRGKGFGKEFFFKLQEIIRKDGYSDLEWSCLDWNTPSIEFYKRLGATEEKGRVYFAYKDNNK